MIDIGDVYLSDFGEERRRRGLVVSNERFHRRSNQVLVAPALSGDPDAEALPWRFEVDGTVFALDRLRSLRADRLLEPMGRAPAATVSRLRRVLRTIT
jgi:mRNA-degrading endonuclease toxin of MazEF toxin-antitoxin module